jgi:nicotinamidase-related amidase/MFS family permease
MAAPEQLSATNLFSRRFMTPLFMGSSLNPINSSLIATALVPIATAMHISVGRTAVLVSALYLASSIAQPTAGKLAEEFGPRRVFIFGIMTVLVGGLVGGFAPNFATLIIARGLIGVGTSAGYPSAMLMIRRRSEAAGLAEPPGSVLGGLSIASAATAALGLPIGGVLVDAWGWRTVFFVNVPVPLLTLAMALLFIPRDRLVEGSRGFREIATRIDVAGIVAFGGALTALLVFLLGLPHTDWVSLGLAVVVGGVLVGWELRASHPFFDVRLLATNLGLSRTYLRWALTTLCIYTVIYGVTEWLQAGRDMSSQEAGLVLLPMSVVSAVVVRLASRRNLIRLPLLASAISCVVASTGVLLLTTSTPIIWIIVITLMFGITLGGASIGNQLSLYTHVDSRQIGVAAGLYRTFGYIGSIASSAIIAVSFHSRANDGHLHKVALIMVAVSAVSIVIVLADRRVMSQPRALRGAHPVESGDEPPTSQQPPRREPVPLTPLDAKPALVVIDLQKGVQSMRTTHPFDDIVDRAATLARKFRARGLPVVLVNVTGSAPGRTDAGKARVSTAAPPPDWADLVDALDAQPGDHRVSKLRWGAFHDTSLDSHLRELGVTQVVLAGVSTSVGVESTARSAYEHGYHVVLATDAMTDTDADAHHNSLERIFPRLGESATTAEILAMLSEPGCVAGRS